MRFNIYAKTIRTNAGVWATRWFWGSEGRDGSHQGVGGFPTRTACEEDAAQYGVPLQAATAALMGYRAFGADAKPTYRGLGVKS